MGVWEEFESPMGTLMGGWEQFGLSLNNYGGWEEFESPMGTAMGGWEEFESPMETTMGGMGAIWIITEQLWGLGGI